ncbi:MAG: acetyl-CoA carboxylase biotin carboxyl carrier protein [Alphaproteobacteria bacterium]
MAKLTIDKDLIRELADLLDETGLTEIEIEDDDMRIRVGRGGVAAAPVVAAPAPAVSISSEPTAEADVRAHPGAVTSPMVGTVYLAPEPGKPVFVKVGDSVAEGQTLLIIEAMKTMNPVEAPRAGIVKQILVENEKPVEFGEPLLIIE